MSNVLGTVTPIAEIIRLAHAVGAKVLIDGCQGSVHEIVDVQALDCDFYVTTGHKLYGPTGIGFLYGKYDAAGGDAALSGRRRNDRRRVHAITSPMPRRRTASRPARRRSSRPSGSAWRWII